MNKKRTPKMIYRYYEIPPGSSVLAILRENSLQKNTQETDHLHFHNHLEIGYCYEGYGNMFFSDEKYAYNGDMFTIIPTNFPHKTLVDGTNNNVWEYLIIDANGFLTSIYKDNPSLAAKLIRMINRKFHLVGTKDAEQIAFLIRQILEVIRAQQELYVDEANALTLALLIRLAQWNRKETDAATLPHAENSTILSPALDYISMVPERPIKIEKLAEMCHISEPHFRRLFGSCMKMSPVKYINQVRIRRACDELKRTDEPIASIAARTGFSTLSTFNRNFRHIMGISPQQWRKNPEQYEWKLLEYDIQAAADNTADSP